MGREERTYGGAYDASRQDDYPNNAMDEEMSAEEFTEDKSILSEDSFCPMSPYNDLIHR